MSPEQQEESIGFNNHSDQWISEQNNADAAEERKRGLDLFPLEEESERPFQPNDTSETAYEQYLQQ